jgi:RNA polymerase sigma-70 factor (ECF subfamily)
VDRKTRPLAHLLHEGEIDNPERGLPLNESRAWDEYVRQNGRRLFVVAYRILRDEAAAADACQQALCRAWACRAQLRDPGALGAWIHRAVTNECYGLLRKRRLRDGLSLDRQGEPGARGAPPQQAWEHGRDIQEALDALPAKTRAVVVLRLVHGYSGNEASECLGVGASEISRRLHEGMESLRRLLRAGLPGQGDDHE